jgi:hypothetical protein
VIPIVSPLILDCLEVENISHGDMVLRKNHKAMSTGYAEDDRGAGRGNRGNLGQVALLRY